MCTSEMKSLFSSPRLWSEEEEVEEEMKEEEKDEREEEERK